jgi:radical SAM superfamily enzyme YgiQ (UPF0313 family)
MGNQAKIDVLMVTPPSRTEVYQGLSTSYAAIEPPVWSGLIAEFLRNRGYMVGMLDAEAESLSCEATADRIAETDATLTVYMIYGQQPSASTQCMPAGRKVAERVNSLTDRPSLVIGTHPSALPERTLREEPYTYVCQGEGPYTALGLIEHLNGKRPLAEVEGLVYHDGGTIRSNSWADKIKDLDGELPRQALDLLDMRRYRSHNWQGLGNLAARQPYVSIQTSLGCPYKCTFCCINAPFGGSGIRYWSPEAIVKQIDEVVAKYGARTIKIPDEMFVLNKRHVLGICDLLIERNYDLNIWAYARIDTIQPDFLEKLRAAGFQWLGIGIESGSKFVRDGVVKGKFGNEDIDVTIQRVRDHGINVSGNYIFGLPDDTYESMEETLQMALRLNTEWANFYSAMAYPGSPLYGLAKERGWPLPDDPDGPGWIGYSQHGYDCLPLPSEHLSAVDVLSFRDEAFARYFTHPDYLSMLGKRFNGAAVDHINEMMSVKLPRRHHVEPGYYNDLRSARAGKHQAKRSLARLGHAAEQQA